MCISDNFPLKAGAKFVRNRVAVPDIALHYSVIRRERLEQGVAAIITDVVPLEVYMSQGLVTILDEFSEPGSSWVANLIPAEIQAPDHISATQEVAQLFDVVVCDV